MEPGTSVAVNPVRGSASRGDISRWGVHKLSTAAAVGVVALALLVGGVILLVLLHTSLRSSAESAAHQKIQEVIVELEDMDVADAQEYIAATARAGQLVQLLDPAGYVVASSDPAAASTPLSAQRPGPGQTETQEVSSLPSIASNDDFFIVTTGMRGADGVYTAIVAFTTQVQADTISTVAWFMLVATPLLLGVVAVSVWLLVGRSLRQVERIREQVTRINAQCLDGRVDVPPTNDEIQALALTMNTMLDRLQTSDLAQRRFISDASHELRSPLATLQAGVEIASADPSGAIWMELQAVLAGETARLSYLVEDLLTLAKASDGGLRLEDADVDLDDVADQEVRRLRSTSTHRITAELSPARIRGDARRLTQVLRNVLDNADKHAVSGIMISLAPTPEGAVLTVDNDGEPVPAADREKIFERFVRLDGSRSREGGGSGLGLAIAAGIMAAHHGRIRATEGPDGGCRFELVFPAPEAGLAAPLIAREVPGPPPQGPSRR